MKRPNGTGNAYRRGKTWTARCVDHYVPADNADGFKPVWKTKGGFRTKKDAINYLPELIRSVRNEHPPAPFLEVFEAWKGSYTDRISAKTMEGYVSAFRHFEPLHYIRIDTISTTDLQRCITECKHGKRTKQLMKVIAGLVFKYAMDDSQIQRNPAENIYIGKDETTHYAPLTEEELARVEASGLPYSDYVVAMCYLGHRPAEFFALKKTDLHREGQICYLIGGIKTEAGKDRAVTIPPKIMPIIQRRLAVEGTDLLFPRQDKTRAGAPAGFSEMPVRYFNKFVWHPLMDALGLEGRVPYATRHTYANKIKRATGDEKDKAGLMGHASYDTTRTHYQTTSLEEKAAITDQMA